MKNVDPVLQNEWFAVGPMRVTSEEGFETTLLGEEIVVKALGDSVQAMLKSDGSALGATVRYGNIWLSFSSNPRPLFELPEYDHPDRRHVYLGSIGVHANGLRVVENFLDMAHFPYVHANLLGAEPHTEVKEYSAEIREETGEIWAQGCEFVQPRSNAASTMHRRIDYVYRVMNPYTPMLYKTSDGREGEMDLIFLFVQPVSETRSLLHYELALFDNTTTDTTLSAFQQLILGQDKPILENHNPQLIPTDPKFEVPVRADAASAVYRRRLRSSGLQYGMQKAA